MILTLLTADPDTHFEGRQVIAGDTITGSPKEGYTLPFRLE